MTSRRDAIEREIRARCSFADEGNAVYWLTARPQREVLLRTLIALLQHLGSNQ